MSKKHKRRTKIRFGFRLNIGAICFLAILVYLVIQVGLYFTKSKIASYQVTTQYSEDTILANALVLRSEKVLTTNSAGYVTYYVRDGEKIGKNSVVYTVDETGTIYDLINESQEENNTFTEENYADINDVISNFRNYYSDNEYKNVYDFKYRLENTILDITNETVIEQVNKLMKEKGTKETFQSMTSPDSGIVTYSYDGLEGTTVDTFTEDSFDSSKYSTKQMRNSEIYKNGTPAFRLTTGLDWNMVIPLSSSQVKQLNGKKSVGLRITKDNRKITVPVKIIEKSGKSYFIASFNDFMINYINDRYLDVEIIVNSVNGLKLPNSCLKKEKLYKIPKSYGFTVKDTDIIHFLVQRTKKSGATETENITPDICYSDKDYYYVTSKEIPKGTILMNNGSSETFVTSAYKTFDGVYSINQGYVKFVYVEILHKNNNFAIVSSNSANSIAMYDQLILDSSTVKEGDILY